MNFSLSSNIVTSPTSKMKMLNDRWQQIQHEIDKQKQFRQQNLQQQLAILDNKLTHMKPLHHQKTQLLLQRIQKLKQELKVLNIKKGENEQNFEKKIKKIEDGINLQIQKQKQQRNDKVESWIKQSDQKLIDVCNSIEEVTNQKSQTVDMITQKMKKRIFDLQQSIQTQGRKRQEATTQLTENIQKELNILHSQLDCQKRARQQTTKKMSQMMQKIRQKLQEQIEQQKKQRKQTNQALLCLLQQTCLKVEKAFY